MAPQCHLVGRRSPLDNDESPPTAPNVPPSFFERPPDGRPQGTRRETTERRRGNFTPSPLPLPLPLPLPHPHPLPHPLSLSLSLTLSLSLSISHGGLVVPHDAQLACRVRRVTIRSEAAVAPRAVVVVDVARDLRAPRGAYATTRRRGGGGVCLNASRWMGAIRTSAAAPGLPTPRATDRPGGARTAQCNAM